MSSANKAPGAGLRTHRRKAFPHSKWCGHPKSHLDHCCFMRKGLEFAPQQMPGPQSQLGGLVGLVGGRGRKTRWKVARVGLNSGPQALSQRTQPVHPTATTHTHTHTHTHIHTHTHTHTHTHSHILEVLR